MLFSEEILKNRCIPPSRAEIRLNALFIAGTLHFFIQDFPALLPCFVGMTKR